MTTDSRRQPDASTPAAPVRTEAPRRRGADQRHGIARRVTVVAVISAACGGLLAAGVAVFAVDQLILEHVDQRLRAATLTLAGELDEEREERLASSPPKGSSAAVRDSVTETLDDENQEIASSGIRLAVFAAGARVAGEPTLPLIEPGRCETLGMLGARLRACGRAHLGSVLIAAQPSDAARLRWLYLAAVLGAVALGAGIGALLSRAITRWAVGPLSELTNAIARSRPEGSGMLDLGPASDCADVEAIREELARLMDRVQALLAQSQRFAADAAHELRTPLTALRAELELHAEDLAGEDRRVLSRACERVARLSELIERLLVLALPPEHLRQGFTAVSLAELAEEVVADLPEPERQRVHLELECEGLVRGDNELLRALIANALQNALKFAARGPVTLQLTDQRTGEQPLVRLLVKDIGPGVPSGLRQRVFEPFYRGAPNATPGHGIGLALMGHIASAHSGRAEFLDTSEGACLAVSLPGWSARNLPCAPVTPVNELRSRT